MIIIGAGSGGYAAARTARGLGASVAFVDRGPLGGLCILRGCMPSKTLIASGDLVHAIEGASELAVQVGRPTIDFPALAARKTRLVREWADYRISGIETFKVFTGSAEFISPTRIRVGDEELEAEHFIIGTGSVTAPNAIPGLAEAGFIDSDAALDLDHAPASMIVLGGGYVGCELGQFFNRAGSDVTILLRSAHVLSSEDHDIGEALTTYLRDDGIRVETGAKIDRVSTRDGKKVVHYRQDGESREAVADEIFYALGRTPAVEGLNLEAAGVEYHPITGIAIDDTLRTTNPNIFAIGDVTGKFALVHVAIQQGEVAGRNAAKNGQETIDYALTRTHTVFTDPQLAVVGKTERELTADGTPYQVASYPFNDHGKAVALGKTRGFVKMMASPDTGKILGAAILGPEASDLIEPLIVAMAFGSTAEQYAAIPHLHPTLVEILTYPAEELMELRANASGALAAATA